MLHLHDHLDALAGSILGLAIGAHAAANPPSWDGAPEWVRWFIPIASSLTPILGKYLLGLRKPAEKGAAAAARSKAASLRKRADALEANGEKAAAGELRDRADTFDAAAAAFEAAED